MRSKSLTIALRYLPLLLGCAAIFLVSSMPRPPVPELLLFKYSDKVMHAVAYCVLAGLALVGAQARVGALTRRAQVEAALVALLYGLSDELHQSFVPGRTMSAADVLADATGGLFGAFVLGGLWLRLRRAARQPS